MEKHIKVLVTGGLGFIGSNLTVHFCKLGHEVTVLDNLDSRMGAGGGVIVASTTYVAHREAVRRRQEAG